MRYYYYYTANNELPGPQIKAPALSKFHRPQHCHKIRGEVPAVSADKVIGIGGSRLTYVPRDEWESSKSAEERRGWSEYKPDISEHVPVPPNWIRKEKQVLRFNSYFLETIVDQGVERKRLRRCELFFYLEDDSLKVMEPIVPNSGIPQGNLVRRHRVPYTYPKEEEGASPAGPWNRTYPEPYITQWDLNVRKDVIIYGRKHRIYDCDRFTRQYLENQGLTVPPPEPEPEDFHKATRNQGNGVTEVRRLNVHFYLEDETLEIVESHGKNCGRYRAPTFLKRCRLPKSVSSIVALPGTRTEHTLLNVVRSKGPGRIRDAVLIDNLENRDEPEFSFDEEDQYYHADDFDIGQIIKVGGREVLLYDCDEFTRAYFADNYHKDLRPLREDPEVKRGGKREIAPYTGFGTEEDSLTSCEGLEPRAPQRDFHKFMERDRDGFESHVLRFSARLVVGEDKVDTTRKFVIFYHLSDDTILINQIPLKNTGLKAGRFLQRGKIKKPEEEQGPERLTQGSVYYTSEDLYVGAVVKFNDHVFVITEADEYVFQFMERPEEREKYPHSNIRLIMKTLDKCLGPEEIKAMMASFMCQDPDDEGTVTEGAFRSVLRKFLGYKLSEHELVTLTRHFRSKDLRHQRLPASVLFSLLQSELRRTHFNAFADVVRTCQAKDVDGTGTLPKDKLRHTLVASMASSSRASHKDHGIRNLIDSCLQTYGEGELNYEEVLKRMDWLRNPARPVPPQLVLANFYEFPLQNEFAPIAYRDLVARLEAPKSIETSRKIKELESKEEAKTNAGSGAIAKKKVQFEEEEH